MDWQTPSRHLRPFAGLPPAFRGLFAKVRVSVRETRMRYYAQYM